MDPTRRNITPLPDYGKVPPQATDIEDVVLGAMLIDRTATDNILAILKPETFYKDSHQKIYCAIKDLASREFAVDLYTVCEELRANGNLESIGGPLYLTQLTSKISSSAHVEYHARIIQQKYIQRELIRIGTEIQNRSFDDTYDLTELLDFAENEIFQVSSQSIKKEPRHLSQCIDDLLIQVGKIFRKEQKLMGVPSGYIDIDRKTGGFQQGNLIIVAGRPSMGKTALAQSLCENASILKYPVALFSQEMSDSEISARCLSGETGYSNLQIRNAEVDYDKLCLMANNIAGLPIFIDDTQNLTLLELRSKVKKLILKEKVSMIVIDYLQLMRADAKSREQEVSTISRGLKSIAKEFSIPVIALAQLNRDVEKRSDKRPQLADLRDSGSIEQDADMVWFIFRPSYYNFAEILIGENRINSSNLMLIDCVKNRSGPLFSIPLYHNKSFTKITETKIEENEAPY